MRGGGVRSWDSIAEARLHRIESKDMQARLHRTVGVKVGDVQVGGGRPGGRPVDDDDRHGRRGGHRASGGRAVGGGLGAGAGDGQRAGSRGGGARDQAAHARRRLHGAADRRLSLQRAPAADAVSRLRGGPRQVSNQSRQRRHRQAARRAVRDDLQGRRRTTASRCASASTAAPSTRSW